MTIAEAAWNILLGRDFVWDAARPRSPDASALDSSLQRFPRKENAIRKSLLLLTSASLVAISALAAPAMARDRGDHGELTASQMTDQADARTAQMKVYLRLTPDQEKNWSGFASAMQDMSKKRADRAVQLRDQRAANPKGPVDALQQINDRADSQINRANDWKALATASKPLYSSLDEQQKQRFSESLFSQERDRDTN